MEPGYKLVQSCHALADYAAQYENEFRTWQCKSNYLCCLELEEFKFDYIISRLDDLKIKYSVFVEPDIDNARTAIAVEAIPRDTHKQLFKKIKLALS